MWPPERTVASEEGYPPAGMKPSTSLSPASATLTTKSILFWSSRTSPLGLSLAGIAGNGSGAAVEGVEDILPWMMRDAGPVDLIWLERLVEFLHGLLGQLAILIAEDVNGREGRAAAVRVAA